MITAVVSMVAVTVMASVTLTVALPSTVVAITIVLLITILEGAAARPNVREAASVSAETSPYCPIIAPLSDVVAIPRPAQAHILRPVFVALLTQVIARKIVISHLGQIQSPVRKPRITTAGPVTAADIQRVLPSTSSLQHASKQLRMGWHLANLGRVCSVPLE
eukprot:CAMPEP_0172683950 /NCGR_PEP_ID=MMETSP1074-20121228/19213_1 /TAXON_ID=2916 /ORGANISM="Ceratium fusus, Strain PA161109" /LENGTH=162 /DNA_ID=CAMNT_0013502873 /DNA_START=245 /DNA_END=731 /DNA_ORIENTATION=+